MATTKRETVRILIKTILNKLEHGKVLMIQQKFRKIMEDEVYSLVGNWIMTEEDLREKALQKIGAAAAEVEEAQLNESPQYRSARAVVRKSFGDDELNGFYFQKSLKFIAEEMRKYFMRSSHVDDVFETDEDLEKEIVEIVRKFNPDNLH